MTLIINTLVLFLGCIALAIIRAIYLSVVDKNLPADRYEIRDQAKDMRKRAKLNSKED